MRDPLFEEYLRARFGFDEAQPPEKKLVKLPSAERRAKARKLIEVAARKVKKEGEGSSDA
jgi:hypothetical protein